VQLCGDGWRFLWACNARAIPAADVSQGYLKAAKSPDAGGLIVVGLKVLDEPPTSNCHHATLNIRHVTNRAGIDFSRAFGSVSAQMRIL
jgi:hypothetical protein